MSLRDIDQNLMWRDWLFGRRGDRPGWQSIVQSDTKAICFRGRICPSPINQLQQQLFLIGHVRRQEDSRFQRCDLGRHTERPSRRPSILRS